MSNLWKSTKQWRDGYWANEFELNESHEIAKSVLKFRLTIGNAFEGVFAVESFCKELKDELVVYIARNFPLVQETPGFKKALMNLDQYPGGRDVWLEVTETMKQLGNAYYLSVPLI